MARKLDKRKPHTSHGPGAGRDVWIQDGRLYNVAGNPLPMVEEKLLDLGYGVLMHNGQRVLHPKVKEFLDQRKIVSYENSISSEIQKKVEEYKKQLEKEMLEREEKRKQLEKEAEELGVDMTKVDDEAGREPTEEDFEELLDDLDDLDAEVE